MITAVNEVGDGEERLRRGFTRSRRSGSALEEGAGQSLSDRRERAGKARRTSPKVSGRSSRTGRCSTSCTSIGRCWTSSALPDRVHPGRVEPGSRSGDSASEHETPWLPYVVAVPVCGLGAILVYAWGDWSTLAVAALVAGGAFLAGGLLGFLFGIPRSLAVQEGVADQGGYQPNTNLEQISDWLTKILVGVGLVQFTTFAGHVSDLVTFLGSGARWRPPWRELRWCDARRLQHQRLPGLLSRHSSLPRACVCECGSPCQGPRGLQAYNRRSGDRGSEDCDGFLAGSSAA